MNPEEVKKLYFKSLQEMLEGTNPQDKRTALAELGKMVRNGVDSNIIEYATKIVALQEELERVNKVVDEKIKALEKATNECN